MGSSIEQLMKRGAQPPPDTASLDYRPGIGEVMQQGPSIGDLMSGTVGNRRPPVTGQVDLNALPPEEPGFVGKILEMLEDTGKDLVQVGKYTLTSPLFVPGQPIVAGKALEDAQLAAQGDPDAQERLVRGMRGSAFVASSVVAGAAGSLTGSVAKIAGGGILKKGLAYLSAEALGGAVYGATTPLEEGITRKEEIEHDIIAFPIAGAALHGVFKTLGWGWRSIFPNVSQAAKDALVGMTKKDAEEIGKRIVTTANDLPDIPPDSRVPVQVHVVEQAIEEQQAIVGQRALKAGKAPTATARVVDQTAGPTEPDFSVIETPQIKKDLGTVSEAELQQELKDVVPKPTAPIDEEAAARARVEAARTTPFPGMEPKPDIPVGITDPVVETMVEASQQPGVIAEAAVKNEIADRVVRETPPSDLMDPPTLAKQKGPIPDPVTDPIELRLQQLKDMVARGEKLPERVPLPEVVDVDKTFAFGEFTKKLLAAQKDLRRGVIDNLSIHGKLPAPKLTNEMIEAWWSGDATQIANTYLDYFNGNVKGATEALGAHEGYVSRSAGTVDGLELSNGHYSPSEVYRLHGRAEGALAALSGADLEETIAKIPKKSYLEQYKRDVTEGYHNAYYDTMGSFKDERPPLTNMNGPAFNPADGPELREGWGGVSDKKLDDLKNTMENFWNSEGGAISHQASIRLAGVALSGASFWAAEHEDDPQARRMLNYVGAVLGIASLMPTSATRKWIQDTKWSYNIVKAVDAARVFSDGTLKGARDYQEIVQGATMKAVKLAEALRPVFKTDLNKVHGMFSFDEGRAAPEWGMLTPDQQREVISLGTIVSTLGRQLKGNGLIKDIRADFIAHLFLDNETRLLWTKQWEEIAKVNPAAARTFASLRSAEAWAKAFKKDAPLMDPTKAMPAYLSRANKMLANDGLRKAYERAGLLQDYSPTQVLIQGASYTAPRDVLRQVKISNLGATKMAPDEVATILERAAYAGSESEFIRSLDKGKSLLMRSIMLWPWEHGINVLRGAIALDGTGTMYREWQKRVVASDPRLVEISKWANLFQRPDFGYEGQTKFDKMLHQIGQSIGAASPTLKNLGIWAEDKRAIAERRLWNEKVPALGAAVWSKEMHDWAQRTGGRFGIGSNEYNIAARRAGDMANAAMGKVPDLMTSPKIQQALRLAMFSPNWTRGRIALSMGAFGEFQKIATGEISPREASYLGYKLRSVLAAMVVTSALSLTLTGKMPEFNPNTLKYYARTGVKDKNGREIGVDLAGWWQDDVKLLNDPIAFYRDRQNPMIRELQTQISGRDIFGRSIATNAERLESLLQMTGPPGEAASLVASSIGHAMRGEVKQAFSPANMIRDLSGMAAVGNVSALPKESDALVNKYAAKLLRNSGLPDDKDRVFELSQYMKRNYAQGGSGFGGEVETYIATQQRQYQKHDVAWLWQQGKRALQNLTR